MVPVSPDQPDVSGGGGADCPELTHVRSALARSVGLEEALNDTAAPTIEQVGMARLGQRVHADVGGAGSILQPLIETEGVADVLVGDGHAWAGRGRGSEPVPAAVMDESEVQTLTAHMAASAHKHLDDACPAVDAILPGDTRLNAVLPLLSAGGTLINLRTKRHRGFTLDELTAAGMITPGLDKVLAAPVTGHTSHLVTGATGTDKTALSATLLSLVPVTECIVYIEEASELHPDHPHVVHLQERGADVQGVGAIAVTSLVRTVLRVRPNRIVLGECRDPEVRDVLTALNTGHEGGWATLHAGSPADIPTHLAALGALAGLDEAAVATRAASTLDAVIHLRRQAGTIGARRRVASISVLRRGVGPAGAVLIYEEALHVTGDGRLRPDPTVPTLRKRIGLQTLARTGLDTLPGTGEGRSV